MKKKFLFLFIGLLFLFKNNVYADEKFVIYLKKCIDGDTTTFILNEEEIKVRYLAIDTPETVHPTKDKTKLGKTSSEYTCERLTQAKEILLEYDPNSSKKDKYQRVLGWIWVDNILLQKELVELGYAEVKYIYGDYLYTEELYIAQEEAQINNKGIWKEKKFYYVTFIEDNKENKVLVLENNKIEPYIPTKEGYRFKGWFLNNKQFDFETIINQDIVLEAVYEKDSFLIKVLIILLLLLAIYTKNKPLKKLAKKKLKKIT